MLEDPLLLRSTSRGATSRDAPANSVRVRRGFHYPAPAWNELDARGRHALLVHATARCWTTEPGAISHESAAALWGLPIIGAWPDRVHISTTSGSRSSQGALQVHRISDECATQRIGGLLVTTSAQTVVDLARSRDLRSGLATADAALHRGVLRSAELAELTAGLAPGCRGGAIARLVAALADGRSESVLESLSRAVMFEQGFPRPELQVRLVDSDGEFGRADFGWPGLIGECDGALKYGMALSDGDPSAAVVREKRREDRIRLFSEVVRWGWMDAFRVDPLVRRLVAKGLRPGDQSSWF
ncbi:type IV toxin-antitoxin system AbiEi family antitoxin domain-containing protein [Calidifontibacter indicus]|uniref:type IV toxin-antitoxin system AbiEi family antitoxin domain-containing protein n=1 Tax=Calidifontibacter indicus TaxID=419650 RepID=UPI003D73A255